MGISLRRAAAFFLASFLIIAILGASKAAADIDVNGGTSWGGWTLVGDDNNLGIWAGPPGAATTGIVRIYKTDFTLTATQAVTVIASTYGDNKNKVFPDPGGVPYLTAGNKLVNTNPGFDYRSGDRIIGVGIERINDFLIDTLFIRFDAIGDDYRAASSVGGADGIFSSIYSDKGDFILQLNGVHNNFRAWTTNTFYVANINNPLVNANYDKPYPTNGSGDIAPTPGRSFANSLGNINNGEFYPATSVQYLYNVSQALRDNNGQNSLTANYVIAMGVPGYYTVPSYDSVYNNVVVAIPEPGSMLLAAAGSMLLLPRRSRRQA